MNVDELKMIFERARQGVAHAGEAGARFGAQLIRRAGVGLGAKVHQVYEVECLGPDGRVKWRDYVDNTVVNVGLDEILDKFYKGSAYTAALYVLLTDGTPTPAAGDTMASHVGWVEVVAYDEATREVLTLGAVSGQSVDNSASKASYAINGTVTVGGAAVTTDNTKSGSAGILIGVGAFTGGDKSADSGDTLNVTVTLTMASA
jgi:hypothetical protein